MLILLVTLTIVLCIAVRRAGAQLQCVANGHVCQPDTPGDCGNDNSCCSLDDNTCCDWSQTDCSSTPPEDVCCPCDGPTIYPANDNSAFTPITSVNDDDYRGTHPRGLYIDGQGFKSNTIPTDHKNAGLDLGKHIIPRQSTGAASSDGFIGVLAIGFSNPALEFQDFIDDIIVDDPDAGVNDRLVFVNGARSTMTLLKWAAEDFDLEDDDDPWGFIFEIALDAGKAPGQTSGTTPLAANQVQVLWMKQAISGPLAFCDEAQGVCDGCDENDNAQAACDLCGDANDNTTNTNESGCNFPNWVYGEDGEVEQIKKVIEIARTLFPNLRQVYISNRTYAGHANGTLSVCGRLSPEPWAFENSFTVQELVRLYAFEQSLSPVPWIDWGPELWANGLKENAVQLFYEDDHLDWPCFRICAEGLHPSRDEDVDTGAGEDSGQTKVGELLNAYWLAHDVSNQWYHKHPRIVSSNPANGTIDRLEDFDGETGADEQGTDEVVIKFSDEVREAGTTDTDCDGNTDCFSVTSTCQQLGTPCTTANSLPAVTGVVKDGSDATKYTVTLSKQIVPGHWTTIIANVEDLSGNAIRIDPLDRIDLGFLPGDADGNKTTNATDKTHLQCIVDDLCSPELPARHDQDRDSDVDTDDVTRLQQLLDGHNTTMAWEDVELPDRP